MYYAFDTIKDNIRNALNSAIFCSKRWKTLRDRFAKERRRKEELKRSGSAAVHVKQWKFMTHLQFLQDYISHRRYSVS